MTLEAEPYNLSLKYYKKKTVSYQSSDTEPSCERVLNLLRKVTFLFLIAVCFSALIRHRKWKSICSNVDSIIVAMLLVDAFVSNQWSQMLLVLLCGCLYQGTQQRHGQEVNANVGV